MSWLPGATASHPEWACGNPCSRPLPQAPILGQVLHGQLTLHLTSCQTPSLWVLRLRWGVAEAALPLNPWAAVADLWTYQGLICHLPQLFFLQESASTDFLGERGGALQGHKA